MKVNLDHLEAFIVVAQQGSFTRAARLLNVSQPALTKQIRQLEEALSVRLLDRNTRSVTLTRIGRDLAPVVQRLLREVDAVIVSTQALSARSSGLVTIAALPSLASTLLPALIARFRERYPGIGVVLHDVVTRRLIAEVKGEEADLGVGSFSGVDPECEFHLLFTDRMIAVCPRGSTLASRKRIALKDLLDLPLVLVEPGSSVRGLVDQAFESIGHYVTPAYEVAHMSTALAMVRAGLGATILPSAATEVRTLEGLCSRAVERPAIKRDIGVILKVGRSLSPAAEAFSDFLTAECRTLRVRAARPSK